MPIQLTAYGKIVFMLICCGLMSSCGIEEKVAAEINDVFSHDDDRAQVTVFNEEASLLSYTWYAATDTGFGNLSARSSSMVRMQVVSGGETVRIELSWSSGHDRVMYVHLNPNEELQLDLGIAPVLAY